jgi:alkyldihydroxyacetonephosphate synthase
MLPGLMPGLSHSELLERLAALVGPAHVSASEADRVAYGTDFWPRTQIWKLAGEIRRYPPDCVVWPADEAEVSKVVALCSRERVPIVAYGAGSGVCGGTIPIQGGVVVDTKRMRRLLEVDHRSLSATAQAGINGQHLEDRLNARGITLGHFPSSIMCSTLGGWLACRSAGQFSSKYGKIEDMVMSLRVVLPDGRVLDTADRTPGAPDWTQLLVGSEGTLGIITSARLKVWPVPEARALRGWRFRQLSDAFQAMRQVMQSGLTPMVLRLYDPFDTLMALGGQNQGEGEAEGLLSMLSSALGKRLAVSPGRPTSRLAPLVTRAKRAVLAGALAVPGLMNQMVHGAPSSCLLIIGFEGGPDEVQSELWRASRVFTEWGGVDLGEGVGNHWLKNRYQVSFKQTKLYQAGAWVDTMEVATTWAELGQLFDAVTRAVTPHALVMAHFSHAYREGCSIYFTFAGYRHDKKRAEEDYEEVWRVALDAVHATGATASHHHGVGLAKKHAMQAEHGGMLRAWRALKDTLDPHGIMNPGKLFPDGAGAP